MRAPNKRWTLCGLLLLATIINYLDRQTISVSASRIADELHLTDKHLGELFSAFLFAYGIGQVVLGPLLDRMGTVIAYAIAVAAWSISGAASGIATGFGFLLMTRIALGLCESPNWPLALRVVARSFPPGQRVLATGIFQSGTSIGALIAPPIVIYLATTHGWRSSFLAVGAVGFAWVALWLLWFRSQPDFKIDQPAAEEPVDRQSAAEEPATLGDIVRSRAFWGLAIATSFLNPLQYFYTTWIPRYFDKYAGVGFGAELAQRLIIVYLALDVGLWSGGGLIAWLARRWEVRKARLLVTAIGGACMMTVPLVAIARDLNVITGIISLATFGLGWFMGNYLTFSAEVSRKRTSTAVGLLGGIGSLAGAGFMLLVGGSIERSGSFSLAFLMAGLMPAISFIGIVLGTRTPRAKST
ncbi:MAG: MFS transporter [Opitutaceae bacterium]|jgi:ACS family hexuronate transporter-like MFS transporter|nr:MFS transporter [Opitutaceae bacterium]